MKLDAQKKLGVPSGHQKSREVLAGYSKDSSTSIQRYIRLTYLIPELLKIVDNTVIGTDKHSITMGIRPAVELSYLNKDEQQLVYSEMTYDDLSPTHAQAIKIRKLSETKRLNAEILEDILMQEKGNQHEQISFNKEKIVSVLPHELINRDKRYVEEYIVRALQSYSKKLERGDENDLEL
jgi:ParB family chromosome partitioning protein